MKALSLFVLLSMSFAAVGCGPPYKVYPVTGRVTMDGAPLVGATVTLKPVSADGKPASGTCDKDGNYSVVDLRPEGASGAAAGDYKVGILWYKPSVDTSKMTSGGSAENEKVDDSKAAHKTTSGPKSDLPTDYQNPDTSELTLTVKPGSNKGDFALDSKFKGKAK
jgi:hypothetical protein